MDRRALLSAIGLGLAILLSGCLDLTPRQEWYLRGPQSSVSMDIENISHEEHPVEYWVEVDDEELAAGREELVPKETYHVGEWEQYGEYTVGVSTSIDRFETSVAVTREYLLNPHPVPIVPKISFGGGIEEPNIVFLD